MPISAFPQNWALCAVIDPPTSKTEGEADTHPILLLSSPSVGAHLPFYSPLSGNKQHSVQVLFFLWIFFWKYRSLLAHYLSRSFPLLNIDIGGVRLAGVRGGDKSRYRQTSMGYGRREM